MSRKRPVSIHPPLLYRKLVLTLFRYEYNSDAGFRYRECINVAHLRLLPRFDFGSAHG